MPLNPIAAILDAAQGFPHAECPDGARDCNQARIIVDTLLRGGIDTHPTWADWPGMLELLGFAPKQYPTGSDLNALGYIWVCGPDDDKGITAKVFSRHNGRWELQIRGAEFNTCHLMDVRPWDLIILSLVYRVPINLLSQRPTHIPTKPEGGA